MAEDIFKDISGLKPAKDISVKKTLDDEPKGEYKVFFVIKEGCPACSEAEKAFEKEIKNGEIGLIKIDDPEFNIVKKELFIRKVPTCVIKDLEKGKYYYCSEDEEKKQYE